MLHFDSMPNFRKLGREEMHIDGEIDLKVNEDDITITQSRSNAKIYRSSRPDFLTEKEVEQFKSLKIKSIIDLRSATEYKKHHKKLKLLDKHYTLFKVKVPQWRTYKQYEKINIIPLNPNLQHFQSIQTDKNHNNNSNRHIFINFFNLNYVWEVFNRIPFLMRIVSLFYLLLDFILGTDNRYFIRFFAKQILNKQGLIGQYIDIINNSQASICAALKLLCDPENYPVMLNCAHGKDRTGIVSALILSCLGCSKEFICQDYARSTVELKSVQDMLEGDIVHRYHLCPSFMTAEAHNMRKALDYIEDKYGNIPNYLETIGLSIQEQQMLRDNLL